MRDHGVDVIGAEREAQRTIGNEVTTSPKKKRTTTTTGKTASASASGFGRVGATMWRRGASTSARGDDGKTEDDDDDDEDAERARAVGADDVEEGEDPVVVSSEDVYVLEFDGASRGNPGEAGAGALLRRKRDDRIVEELLEYLGRERTVNEAEYAALCLGLRKAVELGITKIDVRGDSKLIVNQVDGSFKLKSANLKSMHAEAVALKEKFDEFKISHVKREFNKHADQLANMAVDFGLSPNKVAGSGFMSGGSGGLGGGGLDDGDGSKRRKVEEKRMARGAGVRRGYHTIARAFAAPCDDSATAGLASVPIFLGASRASSASLAATRRAWLPIAATRAALGFARLRL